MDLLMTDNSTSLI